LSSKLCFVDVIPKSSFNENQTSAHDLSKFKTIFNSDGGGGDSFNL
jgi:hypothetical protein